MPYNPVIGSLNIPICGVKKVNSIKQIDKTTKVHTDIILLHLNLLTTSKYDIASPNITAIIKELISIIDILFPIIPV